MSNAAVVDTSDRIFAGILFTSLSYVLFSSQDAMIKLLVAGISVWQVLFFRGVTVLVGCAILGGPKLFRDAARSPIIGSMFLRSVLILCAWLCYYSAARTLQLAELTTIYFAAPVMVTILSVLILREKVPAFRWLAVLVGFAGVFIACDPANLGFTIPVMLVLCGALFWALCVVLLRKTAMKERTMVQLLLNNVFFLVMAGLPMLFFWHTPDAREAALLVGVGAIGGIGQFMMFEGMKRAPVSVIAPFEYTALVWAFVFGYLIWGDIPRGEVFVGAALIVGAGFIIIASEHWRKRS